MTAYIPMNTHRAGTSLAGSLVPALGVFIGMYAVMAVVAWAVYLRKGSALASAGI